MSEARHNIEAEQYVLGAALVSAGRVLEELTDLRPDDFYRPTHESLWARFLALWAEGRPVEPVAVAASLTEQPIRGVEHADLLGLLQACSSAANAGYYARIVTDLARLRRIQSAAARIHQLASTASLDDVEAAAQDARQVLDNASADRVTAQAEPFHELVLAAMDRWETPDTRVLASGLYDLDRAFSGGFRPGHLVVLGARPAVGKSVVGAVLAHAIAKHHVGSLLISLEMTKDEIVDRVVANAATIDLARLTTSNLRAEDWTKAQKLFHTAPSWPLWIDDRTNITVNQIRARARTLTRQQGGLGLLVVDYLQIVRPADERAPREQQVSGIARDLKVLAKEFQVPVVALAQVGRQATVGLEKRPEMHHLRESGGIEAHADEIVLLHRDDKEMPGEIEFNIVKNRHGRTGQVSMAWAPHYSRVASLESA